VRICFVSRRYWPAVSGMSAYAENLLRALTTAGHEVTLVSQYRGDPQGRAVYGGGPPPPDRVPAGVRVVAVEALGEQAVTRGLPADFEADVATLRDTVTALHAREPWDMLHAQYGFPPGSAVLEASELTGVPAVVSIQGGDGHWVGTCCRPHREAIRRVLHDVPAVLIGSCSFADEVATRHEVPRERFRVVEGATDTELFSPRDGRRPGDLGDPPVLLYHGRVDARKGVFDLLEAVRLLVADGRKVRLLISGVGPDAEDVARRVADTELAGMTELLGPVDYRDAAGIYRRGDVFVSPTWAEGFSNTILEAMATGLPVVSTRVVGVVDCVTDGVNGVLVEPRSPRSLADAVARVLDDSALRHAMADTALEMVRARWSWPVAAARIQAIYDAVLRGRDAAGPAGGGSAPSSDAASTVGTGPVVRAVDRVGADAGAVADVCRFRHSPHLL